MIVLLIGIFLTGATGFDALGLSPPGVDSKINYVKMPPSPLPVEERVPNVHNQDCPQNELLVEILNILTTHSNNYLDEPTKSYVLSLLNSVLQNSPQHERISNDILRNHPDNIRDLVDNKNIKITVQYELPALNNCQESLENLYKIINVLNQARTPGVSKFYMTTEDPEHYKIPERNQIMLDKINKNSLKDLFESPKNNIIDLLENYRPKVSVPVKQNNIVLDESVAIPQKPINSLIQMNYDYNRSPELPTSAFRIPNQLVQPKTDNLLEPVGEKVLWRNPYQPLQLDLKNMDQVSNSNPSYPNNDDDLLKAVLAIAQNPPPQSDEDKEKDLTKAKIIDPYIYSRINGQYSPVDNQLPTYNYGQVADPMAIGNDNIYESYAQNGRAQVVPYSGQSQLHGVNFSNANQITNPDKVVEITYVLQQPKKVHYEPVYLIKYRLPLRVFEEYVHKIILSKPFLRHDPNKLYRELLASLKVDGRFSQVTELKSDEIHHVNSVNENVNPARSKVEEIEDELQIIKELNSNVSSSDLLLINNGTVENELKRLKRHPLLNEKIFETN